MEYSGGGRGHSSVALFGVGLAVVFALITFGIWDGVKLLQQPQIAWLALSIPLAFIVAGLFGVRFIWRRFTRPRDWDTRRYFLARAIFALTGVSFAFFVENSGRTSLVAILALTLLSTVFIFWSRRSI